MEITAQSRKSPVLKLFGIPTGHLTTFPIFSISLSIYLSIYLSIDVSLVALIIVCVPKSSQKSIKIFPSNSQNPSKIFQNRSNIAPKIAPESQTRSEHGPKAFFMIFSNFWSPRGLPKSSRNR